MEIHGKGLIMKNKNKYIWAAGNALVAIAALAAGIFFFLGGTDFSQNQKEDSRLIGASYMTMNNEFYKIVSEEITYRVEAEGDRMVLRDPALDVERQIEQIQEMLEMGIDVLILTPVDFGSLRQVLQQAKKQGVTVIVVDTNVADEELVDCTITSDNYQAGVEVGKYFLETHQEAKLVVMTHETTRSGQDRVKGFTDVVLQNENVRLIRSIECAGQVEIAMPKLQEIIDEGVEFDTVFCLNDLTSVGVVAALDENGMLEEVGVYGVDASPDAKALIHEGMMQASAAQFPTQIGKEAAEAIYLLLEGKQVEKKILVPVKLITAENVEEFGTNRWQ